MPEDSDPRDRREFADFLSGMSDAVEVLFIELIRSLRQKQIYSDEDMDFLGARLEMLAALLPRRTPRERLTRILLERIARLEGEPPLRHRRNNSKVRELRSLDSPAMQVPVRNRKRPH
jgi:hypothetical protein